jgi:hypothetical protein
MPAWLRAAGGPVESPCAAPAALSTRGPRLECKESTDLFA